MGAEKPQAAETAATAGLAGWASPADLVLLGSRSNPSRSTGGGHAALLSAEPIPGDGEIGADVCCSEWPRASFASPVHGEEAKNVLLPRAACNGSACLQLGTPRGAVTGALNPQPLLLSYATACRKC